jgi:hypothetical protein
MNDVFENSCQKPIFFFSQRNELRRYFEKNNSDFLWFMKLQTENYKIQCSIFYQINLKLIMSSYKNN